MDKKTRRVIQKKRQFIASHCAGPKPNAASNARQSNVAAMKVRSLENQHPGFRKHYTNVIK